MQLHNINSSDIFENDIIKHNKTKNLKRTHEKQSVIEKKKLQLQRKTLSKFVSAKHRRNQINKTAETLII